MNAMQLEKGVARVYGRLLAYVLPFWKIFSLAIFGMIIYAVTQPAFAARTASGLVPGTGF
jgi:hypothetical protein